MTGNYIREIIGKNVTIRHFQFEFYAEREKNTKN